VLYAGQDTIPFGSRIHALPVSTLWAALDEELRPLTIAERKGTR